MKLSDPTLDGIQKSLKRSEIHLESSLILKNLVSFTLFRYKKHQKSLIFLLNFSSKIIPKKIKFEFYRQKKL